MIAIEFEPPTVGHCPCCNKDTVRLTRFVTQDGAAYAVYFLQYTPSHEPNFISGLVGLGDWDEEALPSERRAFPFRLWASDDSVNVAFTDASESPWADSTYLGPVLDREDALAHPWRQEVFHLTDHMVREDPEVVAFLQARPEGGA